MLQCRTLAEAWRIYDASGASAVKTDPSFRPRSAKSVCKPAVRSDSFIASLACHNNLLPDVIKTKGRGGYEIADKMNMRRTSYAGEASSRSCLPSGESRSICFCVFLFFILFYFFSTPPDRLYRVHPFPCFWPRACSSPAGLVILSESELLSAPPPIRLLFIDRLIGSAIKESNHFFSSCT